MQSYPGGALDRRLQEDWARDARDGPRILMSLRVDFGPMG